MYDYFRSSYDLGPHCTEIECQTKDIDDFGGGTMSQFEYRAVKASLLSAQNTAPVMAESTDDLGKYETFLDTFTSTDKPFAQ